MTIPILLRHVLLVISFRWNVQKLVFLKMVRVLAQKGHRSAQPVWNGFTEALCDVQALYNAQQYKTSVTINVVCDEAAALRRAITTWGCPVTVHQSQNPDNDTNTYSLLWEHREVMQAASMSGASFYRKVDIV